MTDQAVRCDACLFEHPTGAGFVRKKGRIACGPCVAAEKRRDASSRDSAHADLALAAIRRGDLYGARRHFVNISPDYDAPSVREARCLLGPAELSNVLSVCWTDGQPPAEIAAVIRSDAGGDSTPIGHVLRIFSKTADAAQIEAVFAEHGRNPSNATAAVEQLAASLEEQPGDPARRE